MTNIKTWEKQPRSDQWAQITWQWSDGRRPSYPNNGWGLSRETERKRLSEEAFSKRTHTCLVPPQDSWARGFCSKECPCWSYSCCIYKTPTQRSLSNLWLRKERKTLLLQFRKKLEYVNINEGERRPMTGTAFQQLCVIRVCHSRWGSIRTVLIDLVWLEKSHLDAQGCVVSRSRAKINHFSRYSLDIIPLLKVFLSKWLWADQTKKIPLFLHTFM